VNKKRRKNMDRNTAVSNIRYFEKVLCKRLTSKQFDRTVWCLMQGQHDPEMPDLDKNQYAVILGRLGGQAKSEVKAKSSRLNGKLGGRPKKPKLPAPVFGDVGG
jgi:hypothetical protein